MTTATRDRRTDQLALLVSEVLLVAMTATAVLSFDRLFVDSAWVRPLVAATVVAHLTVAVLRRLGRGLLLTGLASLVVMALQITWTHYRDTTTAGLPSATTRDGLDLDITAAWNLFGEVKAPTDTTVGFLVIATVAIWIVAYLSDWAAFRLWSALETVLPSFALFVFVAFFGIDANRFLFAGLYLLGIVAFQLVHRLIRQSHDVRWLAGMQHRGMASVARTGAVVGAIAVLGAVVAGPALPGAEQDAIIDLDQQRSGPNTRVVISPIVDIRGRIVEQADVEAFTVRSDTPSYWRLASLDTFNGQIWGADNKYKRVSDDLPDDFAVDANSFPSEQDFDIAALDMVWIPAAFEPQRILATSDDSISYEPVSGTLIVGRDRNSSDGLSYTVQSSIPTFDAESLAQAGNAYPTEIIERYTGLPDDFSDEATALAFGLVEGKTNDYDRALALQNYFRDNFEYDIEVGEGHSSNRIDAFLASGRGYCEQFAGSFAAMARAVGMPSRVAVGFTWGDGDPNDPTLYHVRGEHAHAWPEVYIPGNGWVAFEPTPTRGAPNSQDWTGVQAAQAGSEGDPTSVPTPAPPIEVDPQIQPEVDVSPASPIPAAGAELDDTGGLPTWLTTTALAVLAALALFGLYALVVTTAKRRQRARRFASASDNRGKVQAVWTDSVERLRPLGLEQGSTETVQEFTVRVARQSPDASNELTKLGAMTVQASYGPGLPPDPVVEKAASYRDGVAAAVDRLVTPTDRWRELLDPRPLLKRSSAQRG